jgi:hypothetical protein
MEQVTTARVSDLIELSAEQLEFVAGGLPKGTWESGLPKGTWEAGLPKGTWESSLPKGTWES